MIQLGSPCRRHRAALIDFVDRRERGPATAAALEHLAGCERCERDLAETALTIIALRRAGRELAAAPVPVGDATRIAAVGREPDRWSWRLQLGGLVTCAAIVALIIVPPNAFQLSLGDGLPPSGRHGPMPAWRAAETRLAATPDVGSFAAIGNLPPRYPEGLTRPWKEVPQTDAAARAPEPS